MRMCRRQSKIVERESFFSLFTQLVKAKKKGIRLESKRFLLSFLHYKISYLKKFLVGKIYSIFTI